MSNIVTGRNMPKDLEAALKKYGMPEHCTGFHIQCEGPDFLLLFTYSRYASLPDKHFDDAPLVVETRTYKLLAVE